MKKSYRRRERGQALDLESKVGRAGPSVGYGLEEAQPQDAQDTSPLGSEGVAAGIYGQRISGNTSGSLHRVRLFRTSSTLSVRGNQKSSSTSARRRGTSSEPSKWSRFSRNTFHSTVSSATPAVHVVCAISENMARETCVASLDAGAPVSLLVTKQGNGQSYEETIAYLEILKPDEVLLNEGRRTSQLTRKVLEFYDQQADIGVHPFLATATSTAARTNKKRTGSHRTGRKFVSNACSHKEIEYSGADDVEEDEVPGGPCNTSTVVKFVSRACFEQTKGAELLRRVAREETYDASVVEEYILLSSAHAVLHYTQQSLGVSFAPKCLHLSISMCGNKRMVIDRSTLLQLELLVNTKTGKAKNSLVGTIDNTKTTVGSRLLRANLMSPPTDVDTTNARLDLVDIFLENEAFFYDVFEHLSHLPDMDKILSSVALIPKNRPTKLNSNHSSDVRTASKGISALVCIKSCLTAMPAFVHVLKQQLQVQQNGQCELHEDQETVHTNKNSLMVGLGCHSTRSSAPLKPNQLLRAIVFALSNTSLNEVLNAVSDAFTPSTEFSRNPNAMRHQECFALKADEEGVISILRKAFLANVDDIYKKADEYAEVFGLTVNVKYTYSRGYFLSVPSEQGSELPDIFIQPAISGRYIHSTTEEINSLNMRSRENVHDLLILTFERTQDVLQVARSNYDSLAALCDAVALLDMCHAFADTVSLSTKPWCRPIVLNQITPRQIHENGQTTPGQIDEKTSGRSEFMIRSGRFGIEVTSVGTEPESYVPNDTFASGEKHFTTITGINGSGKSVLLKQIAMIVVLAHCGCYVPAEQASIPVRDRLCARIGNADDQENNISTFMQEMKETAFICNNATARSLILIDELGRATSNEDGVSIAWAVAEYLLKKKAMTFFVTHYPQLTRLADIYTSVQNIYMDATITGGENGEIRYTHKAKPGACQMESDYGVKLAALCGWPSSVVSEATQIEGQVEALIPTDSLCEGQSSKSPGPLDAFQTLINIIERLKSIGSADRPHSMESLRSSIQHLKQEQLHSCDDEKLGQFSQLLFRDTAVSDPGPPGKYTTETEMVEGSDDASTLSSSSSSSTDSSSLTYASEA